MDVPPDAVHADAHQLRNLRIRPVQVKLELNRHALALGQFADGHAHPIQFLGQDDLSFRVVPAGYLADDRVRHVQELAVHSLMLFQVVERRVSNCRNDVKTQRIFLHAAQFIDLFV